MKFLESLDILTMTGTFYLKEIISKLPVYILAKNIAKSFASEPLLTKKQT